MRMHFLFRHPHPKGAHSGKFVGKCVGVFGYLFNVDVCVLKWRRFSFLNAWKRKELRIRREAERSVDLRENEVRSIPQPQGSSTGCAEPAPTYPRLVQLYAPLPVYS